jgi:hypothetical protein
MSNAATVVDAAARGAASPIFSARTVLWMILAGVFSFSAFVVLSAYEPDLTGGMDGGAHALSRSAIGFAGVVRLLRAEGTPVSIARDTLPPQDAASLYVLTPPESVNPNDLKRLADHGSVLIVLPKWSVSPDSTVEGWVRPTGLIDSAAIQKILAPSVGAVTLTRRTDRRAVALWDSVFGRPGGPPASGPIDQLQTMDAPDLTPILTDGGGRSVLMSTRNGGVYVLSDPDLLNTHGLADLDTARAATAVIARTRQGAGPVVFDVTLNGFKRSHGLLKLAFEPPFLGATLCLAAAALLMALHAASRFGAPKPAPRALAFGKRALTDNAAALIRLARREPRMAGRYLDQTRAMVAKALGIQRLSADDLDAFLDHAAERNGTKGRLSALAPAARAVKTRDELLRFAADLYAWRLEMTRERR